MSTIEKRLHERMPGDYSTALVEHDGMTYLVTLGTGETSYGRDGECAFAYELDDVEDFLAEADIEIGYGEFCARLSPCEDRDLAVVCAMRGYRLTRGGSPTPLLTDDEYRLVRLVVQFGIG